MINFQHEVHALLQLANDSKLSQGLENVAQCLVLAPRYDQDRSASDCMCIGGLKLMDFTQVVVSFG